MTAQADPFHVIASTDGADPCSSVCDALVGCRLRVDAHSHAGVFMSRTLIADSRT